MLSDLKKSLKHKKVDDERGTLSVIEGIDFFHVKRVYTIECLQNHWRGEHYHKLTNQMICLLDGKLLVEVSTENDSCTFEMSSGDVFEQIAGYQFKFKSLVTLSKILILCDRENDVTDYYTTQKVEGT